MIKRVIIFIVMLLLVTPVTTHADMIMGNEFHDENQDDTISIDWSRRFTANSPNGYVIPVKEPGSKKSISTKHSYPSGWSEYNEDEQPKYNVFAFENGKVFHLEAAYLHDGEYWGVMSPSHVYQPTGWVRMSDVLMEYNKYDFERQNQDSFYEYTNEIYEEFISADRIVVWQWPGSDREKYIYDRYNYKSDFSEVHYAYKDEDGREWGYFGEFVNWVCLSDIANKSNIPSFNPAPQSIAWNPDGVYDWGNGEVTVHSPKKPKLPPKSPKIESITDIANSIPYLVNNIPFLLVAGAAFAIVVYGVRQSKANKSNKSDKSDKN